MINFSSNSNKSTTKSNNTDKEFRNIIMVKFNISIIKEFICSMKIANINNLNIHFNQVMKIAYLKK